MMRFILPMLLLVSCDEVHKTDKPTNRDAAIRLADQRLPLPESASDVLFRLSGGTQNWDLFLSFHAPLSKIDKLIVDEIGRAAKIDVDTEAEARERIFKKFPIEQRASPAGIPFRTPQWWKPDAIKTGYFVGLDPSGPYFWVDTSSQRCFFFQHY